MICKYNYPHICDASNLLGHCNFETAMIRTKILPSRMAGDFPYLTAYMSEHS